MSFSKHDIRDLYVICKVILIFFFILSFAAVICVLCRRRRRCCRRRHCCRPFSSCGGTIRTVIRIFLHLIKMIIVYRIRKHVYVFGSNTPAYLHKYFDSIISSLSLSYIHFVLQYVYE